MKKQNRVYVDFHVIQTVPPSCLNRDDTGSPKTALYGGVRRARVSSQSWKRAMRHAFIEMFPEDKMGFRTKKVVRLVADEIKVLDTNIAMDEALSLAHKIVNLSGVPTKKEKDEDDEKTKALFFISRSQTHNLAEYILQHKEDDDKTIKKEAKKLLNKNHSIDIALFGRMVADEPSLNADASSQVAHAISTHRVENEYDYFTAVDDLAGDDSPGAGMIGVVEFNSATLYRYATVAVHALNEELGGESQVAAEAVEAFAKAFITSMPTGKQNTFANRTLPDAVLVALRYDQPVNFVGAFEEPVRTVEGGFAKKSIEKLQDYAHQIYSSYVDEPAKVWSIGMGEDGSLKELLSDIKSSLIGCLG